MNLEEASGAYLHRLAITRTMSDHTLRAYRGDLASLTRTLGGTTPVERLSAQRLVEFIDGQRRRGMAASTIRRRASAVRGFCRWLNRSGEISGDPWRDADISIRQPKRLPRPARDDSVRRLLASLCQAAGVSRVIVPVGPFERPYEANTLVAVTLMLATGIRVGEAVTLRCHDFDPGARSIRVTGKGARERNTYLSCDWIVGLIRAQLATRQAASVQHDRLLFNRNGNAMTTAAIRSRLRRNAQRANVDEHITPHMLRHTAATQLVNCGVNIRFVQRLLGHASLLTTEQYTKVNDTSLRQAVAEANILGRNLA